MRALGVALAFGCVVALTASPARAEPISVSVNSASSGFHADDTTFTTCPLTIDLGTITLNGGASGFISIDGLHRNRDYTLTFDVIDPSGRPWTELTAEVLDPLSDGLNAGDPSLAMQPSYVPAGSRRRRRTTGSASRRATVCSEAPRSQEADRRRCSQTRIRTRETC